VPGRLRRALLVPYAAKALDNGFDAIVAWNTDAVFREVKHSAALRVLNIQVSDFDWCTPGWESRIDMLAPLSRKHAEFLIPQTKFPRGAMRVMPNGVDLEEFKPGVKVPGRCLWASSHDRGLHHLLTIWPEVKRNVPHASLRVLYNTSGLYDIAASTYEDPIWVELRRRAQYSLGKLKEFEGSGVTLVGSVSRAQVAREMAEAEVLAYPCDPARFTETFGVSVLEAMASGCIPVTTDADAFGELWCPPARFVSQAEIQRSPHSYAELLVGTLSDKGMFYESSLACRKHAGRFAWPLLAEQLERTLMTKGKEGFGIP